LLLGYYRLHGKNVSSIGGDFAAHKAAVAEFLPELTRRQVKRIDANFIYLRSRLNFISGNYLEARKDLKIIIRCGSFLQMIKAFWMLCLITPQTFNRFRSKK
jgi:hypothetical protein